MRGLKAARSISFIFFQATLQGTEFGLELDGHKWRKINTSYNKNLQSVSRISGFD